MLWYGATDRAMQNLVQSKLVNGSFGRVVAFQSRSEALRLRTEIAKDDKTWGLEGQKQINQRDTWKDIPEEALYDDRMCPIVRFLNGKTLLLTPGMRKLIHDWLCHSHVSIVEFEVFNIHGKVEARRDQVFQSLYAVLPTTWLTHLVS